MDDFIMNDPVFLSLDGEWEFFYSPQRFTPPLSQLPATELYTGRMVTPGYWDDHYELYDEEDFFGLTARFNPDYRKPHFLASWISGAMFRAKSKQNFTSYGYNAMKGVPYDGLGKRQGTHL